MSLIQMSFSGAIMIIAIVIIRAVMIDRLPKNIFLIMWDMVLLRLCVPFCIPSPYSLYSLVKDYTPSEILEKTPVLQVIPNVPVRNVRPVHNPVEAGQSIGTAISIWMIIWGIGAVACLIFFSFAYVKCYLEFRTSLPVNNEFIANWKREQPLLRKMEIRQSDRIFAPLTYGILRPVILMPRKTDWDNKEALQYVLMHEYIHIRRFDALSKMLTTVVLCVHWFNPFVWVMYILFNRDIELSCDECVVRGFGDKSKSEYAKTLIRMETVKSGMTPLCNNFSKNAIEERIMAIMKMKKHSFISILIGVVLVVSVTTACATSAISENGTKKEIQFKNEKEGTDVNENMTEQESTIEQNVIQPLYPLTSAKDALADGGYSVEFSTDSLEKKADGYELNIKVYEYDRYEPDAISGMTVGSKIQFCNEIVEVKSLEKDEENSYITINGGVANNGIELWEEDGLYRTITSNDYPVYYEVGTIAIPLADDVTFEDHMDESKEPDGVVTDVTGLQSALQGEDTNFTCYNTIVTVRQEKIVQVIRYWTP